MTNSLDACPVCGRAEYQYGYRLLEDLRQGVDLPSLVAGVASGSLATVSESGGGFLVGLLKTFKQDVIDGVPQVPLLRCAHCCTLTVVCPTCHRMMALQGQPQTGALLRCGSCQAGFGHCERSDDFDALVTRD